MYNNIHNKKYLKDYRKTLRNNPTRSEKFLWHRLKGSRIGYKFRRQQSIGNFIVDFYCPKVKLAIELDGITHEAPDTYEKDKEKELYLYSKQLKVLRFNDDEIFYNIDAIIDTIYNTCKKIDD